MDKGDLGIGQVIEDAYGYFDYLSPMVYPSHYGKGFLGYANPAQYPFEVIQYSLDMAEERLTPAAVATSTPGARPTRLRPWLQAFDICATYDTAMIAAEIRAAENSLAPDWQAGWLLWDPANRYANYRD